jgi:hypothetical protein
VADPSRTVWPDWVEQPVVCCECTKRVTLKQSHRYFFDVLTGAGFVWHTACDPFTVSVVVERSTA